MHIAERTSWEASPARAYRPAAFAAEGFVHCSEPEQIEAVANRFFRGRTDLVLLLIDEARLSASVRRENLEGGDEPFPHVYGPIEREAVVAVAALRPGEGGLFTLPPDAIRSGTLGDASAT